MLCLLYTHRLFRLHFVLTFLQTYVVVCANWLLTGEFYFYIDGYIVLELKWHLYDGVVTLPCKITYIVNK